MRAIRSRPWGAPAGRRIAGARRARARFLLVILTGLAAAPTSAQVALGIGPLESAGVFREAVGVPKTVVCPAGDGSKASVYGTDVYTDGSPICAAAIHAGVLKPGVAGAVTLVAGSGADAFKGSERNGVTTHSYDRWPYSYSFVSEPVPGTISWRTVWKYLPKEFDGPVELICPPGDPSSAPAWGTDVYTTETSICVAAVHAGIIGPKEGGPVTVVRAPGQDSYAASEQNGVSSRAAGASADAFTVSGGALAGAGFAPGGTATLEPTGDVTSTLPTFGTTTTTAVTPSSPPASTVPPPSDPAELAAAEPGRTAGCGRDTATATARPDLYFARRDAGGLHYARRLEWHRGRSRSAAAGAGRSGDGSRTGPAAHGHARRLDGRGRWIRRAAAGAGRSGNGSRAGPAADDHAARLDWRGRRVCRGDK